MTGLEILQILGIPYQTGPYNVPGTHYHVREGWYALDCPHCSPNAGKFKLGWNASGRGMSCWTCGPQRAGEALVAASGKGWAEVLALLGELPCIAFRRQERPQGQLKVPTGVGNLLPAHERYLRNRGLNTDYLAKIWGIQGIGLASRLAWHLYIPIQVDGKTVSWTTRNLGEHGLRYHAARTDEEVLPAKSVLYGAGLAKHAVIVVEGPVDAWRIGPGAVATLGVNYSKAQLYKIAKYPRRVICMDAEEPAQKQARKLCEALAVFPGQTTNVVTDSKDPGCAPERELNQLRGLIR